MALHFEIKLGFGKRKFDIRELLSENMAFGAYESDYSLTEGIMGSPTIIFDEEHIGRGVEVDIENGKLILYSAIPATNSDVELLFNLLDKALELTKAKKFVYDEETVDRNNLPSLKDEIKNIHKRSLKIFEDILKDEEQKHLLIYGATQVVSIDREKAKEIINSYDEYENYLHQVQAQDLYFAKPMLFQNGEDILGLYTLTSGVTSSFPLSRDFLVDTEQFEVTKWNVGFFNLEAEELMGMISYDEFLESVDTSNMLDAERFIVELNVDEMKALLEKYGEEI